MLESNMSINANEWERLAWFGAAQTLGIVLVNKLYDNEKKIHETNGTLFIAFNQDNE